jgi:hypothetical protein
MVHGGSDSRRTSNTSGRDYSEQGLAYSLLAQTRRARAHVLVHANAYSAGTDPSTPKKKP